MATTKSDGLLKRGLQKYYGALEDSIKTARLAAHSTGAILQGGVFPAADAMIAMNQDVTTTLVDAVFGDGTLRNAARVTSDRFLAATRFETMVQTFGPKLFGTARFEDETLLFEDDMFRLTRIRPPKGVERQNVAVFHSGGSIPYGDLLFRLLPTHNFYARFLERGITVYAMELRGDRYENDYAGMTMSSLVASIDRLSDVAFEDHKGKLVLEGYCGQGTQALAYLAAEPEKADKKFSVLALFVSPVDGSRCSDLAKPIHLTPKPLYRANLALIEKMGGYVPADPTRMGLDMGLESVFPKTSFGYFYEGWQKRELARVRQPEELSPSQQRDIAGSYWVSADCARRFPVPLDIMRFTAALFDRGLDRDGTLPFDYQGRQPRIRDVVEKTSLAVVGFYGGRDPVVPDSTAHAMFDLFGSRYQHVVHPPAGHVSYVLSPKLWDKTQNRRFRPNPIDTIVEAAGKTESSS